ncbi:hypothetical protein BLNAU_2204 [Blattamonas nauphoetae]|uniref:Uncharacterized protein n=1 Tax=Blattamonas nauphoetae TaxID=2049346 RepID=A0ABQ9YG94_9EUKA|nr:hypothetical protein BLNAU_2204 [Blattamonas nauphoetae]
MSSSESHNIQDRISNLMNRFQSNRPSQNVDIPKRRQTTQQVPPVEIVQTTPLLEPPQHIPQPQSSQSQQRKDEPRKTRAQTKYDTEYENLSTHSNKLSVDITEMKNLENTLQLSISSQLRDLRLHLPNLATRISQPQPQQHHRVRFDTSQGIPQVTEAIQPTRLHPQPATSTSFSSTRSHSTPYHSQSNPDVEESPVVELLRTDYQNTLSHPQTSSNSHVQHLLRRLQVLASPMQFYRD